MAEEVEVDSLLFNSGTENDRVSEPLPPIHLLSAEGNITYLILDKIEADLDIYEKISLLFLLYKYENIHLALQNLLKGSRTAQEYGSEYLLRTGLLSEWARSERLINWEERFLEALCIIQNWYVVEMLGYSRVDMEQRHLPENPETATCVDRTRKRLYIFCEKLSSLKESNLIKRIEDEIGRHKTPLFICGDLKCMETFLLYLMSDKHILCQNGVQIITKHLKAMDEMELCDFLEPLSSRHEILENFNSSNQHSDDDISLEDTNRAPSIVSTTDRSERTSTKSENLCYKIDDPNNIGVCVIINQKRFYPDSRIKNPPKPPLKNRTGTDEDRDRLQEAFGHFGFTVRVWENLSNEAMIKAIEHAKTMVQRSHSCFVLCILSHGQRGTVYGANSIPVKIEEIHSRIQGRACPQLIDKLKILIIQACQGDEQQEALVPLQPDGDIASDGVPGISDSLIIASTIQNYVSYRDLMKGSWFIQSLCKQLLSTPKGVDVQDVLYKVNNEVRYLRAPGGMTMQPESRSTLQYKPYLPCKHSARESVAMLMIKRIVFYELLKEYLINEYEKTHSSSNLCR